MKKYKLAVYIGRFQPCTIAHETVINEGLKIADYVLVLVGSANRGRRISNPFLYEERRQMISALFPTDRVIIQPLDDYLSDSVWVSQVQEIVTDLLNDLGYDEPTKNEVTLIGMKKDNTSYYLNKFPQWDESMVVPVTLADGSLINATDVRADLYEMDVHPKRVSPAMLEMLNSFMISDSFRALVTEKIYIDGERKKYAAAEKVLGYPITVQCVDAVCIQSGHVLLIERSGISGGADKWALPGGHVEPGERLIDAAVRELQEETRPEDAKGTIPKGVLKGFIQAEKTIDDPFRSERARVYTQAYLFVFPNRRKLYKVTGLDDAKKAFWWPIGDLDPTKFHDDHYFIIMEMISKMREVR